jgi:hypothetical protein
MVKITLDTNCLFDYFERNSEDIKELLKFQEASSIEIAITTRVTADTFGHKNNSDIWEKIQTFPCITIPTIGRFNVSYWDEDFFAGGEDVKLQNLIQECIGNNIKKLEDVDHLIGHIKSKRDIFVTSDRGDFIKNRECLQEKCSVRIFTPKECVEYLKTNHIP